MDRNWSAPIIEVDGGASRVVYLCFALLAGLIGAVAVGSLFSSEFRGPGLVIAGPPALIFDAITYAIVRRARARRISVHAEGVRETRGAEVTELRWDEVQTLSVRCWQVAASHVGGLGAVGAIAQGAANAAMRAADRQRAALPYDSTQVTVKIAGAGKRIVLKKWDKRWADAYGEIRARVEPRLLVTARQQLVAGGAAFGQVRVNPDAVAVGARKVVPFSELERIDVDRYNVLFRARGKRLPAARAQLWNVPNLHVMLDLVGERTRPTA